MKRLMVAALLLGSALTAQAGILTVTAGGSDGIHYYDDRETNKQALTGETVLLQREASGNSAIASGGLAGFGVLKSSATLGTANAQGGGTSWASSSWEDTLRMENAALTGQRATATFTFALTYMLDTVTYPGGWQVQSSVSSNVFIGANSATYIDTLFNYGTDFTQNRYLSRTDSRGYVENIPGKATTLELVVDFTWGEELRIGGMLQASCVVGWYSSSLYGGCTADAGHSSYWGGISDIVDAEGNQITSYELVSGSGTDYTKSLIPPVLSVPEPETLWLLLAGLLILAYRPVISHRSMV
ncbi:PEP-CTERM sorting domain-containing protein [Duganella guangzhouensis]|nr:PEP-CTERM sorting domain-containing protein [Duganella guangzhouensis]